MYIDIGGLFMYRTCNIKELFVCVINPDHKKFMICIPLLVMKHMYVRLSSSQMTELL